MNIAANCADPLCIALGSFFHRGVELFRINKLFDFEGNFFCLLKVELAHILDYHAGQLAELCKESLLLREKCGNSQLTIDKELIKCL